MGGLLNPFVQPVVRRKKALPHARILVLPQGVGTGHGWWCLTRAQQNRHLGTIPTNVGAMEISLYGRRLLQQVGRSRIGGPNH